MASFEFCKKLTHARLKASYICSQQLCGSPIDALGPRSIINSGDVDVVGENQLLYGSQNVGTLLRIQSHFSYRSHSSILVVPPPLRL